MWGWETTARKAKQLADGCSFSITLCCVNPDAAGVGKGSRGGDWSEWHPAPLQLAPMLEGCARR